MGQKIKTLLKGPLLVQAGYGVHVRQILTALLNDPLFDVHCEAINWGKCSFLTENTPEKQTIINLVRKFAFARQQGNEDYDLFIHCTIPQEFERKGKFNIGVTAGVETDRVSHQWIQKCNEMDLILAPWDRDWETNE